jgi:DNA recombination protein RmuC
MTLLIGVVILLQVAMLAVVLRRTEVDLAPLVGRLDGLEKLGERTDRTFREESARGRGELGERLERFTASLEGRLDRLSSRNEARLDAMRATVDDRLRKIQDDNGKQLDQMRATVDEKLQGTLEKRLGESFRCVSERLEQVHKGLGEMQSLAVGVGDLKRVLTNVKTRGGWGEVQLGALLEQVLTPEQFARNVKLKEGSDEIVEFAVRMPGGDRDGEVFLPIDAKFPTEAYQRLVAAQEAADPVAVEESTRQLAQRIRHCARDIFAKYVNPPRTTDFGILFLPTEGLYAEVARQVELCETVQRESRVLIAGPTILAALLNSLQMGFRTLAVQQRSSEVWHLLGQVKTEFGKFGDTLDGVKKKLEMAHRQMDDAGKRTRAIERKLRHVEAMPTVGAPMLLPGDEEEAYADADEALG